MLATRLFDRAVIRLKPTIDTEDVADFLQGLVTNDVKGKLPVWTGLLGAQGKTMFDFIVWADGQGELLLDCEAAAADDLVKRLSLYCLRRKIAITLENDLGVHWQAEEDPKAAENTVNALNAVNAGVAAPDPRLSDLGWRWLAPVSSHDEAADAKWQAHRLHLGVGEGRADLGDILWLETNAADLNGVSFEKGCYIGQENTARMNWRQKINRRLVVVPIDRSSEKRRKTAYPDLGLALDHLRTDDITSDLIPNWMDLSKTPDK